MSFFIVYFFSKTLYTVNNHM